MAEKNWYIIHAYSGFEKYVGDQITALNGSKIEEILIPTEKVIRVRRGKKVIEERKIFPGYVLIKMDYDEDLMAQIARLPRVAKFLGPNSIPMKVGEKEIEQIFQQIEKGLEVVAAPKRVEVGELVVVIDGPFKDFKGAVEEIDPERSRLKVMVSIFGRETPVDLNFDQIEKET